MARARTTRPHRLALAGALAALVLALQVQAPAQSAQTPLNLYGRGAAGANGVVAAAKPEASRVGIDILKMGGNAVDAAVATGFALGVLEPNASGIGGGGFMVVKLAGMKEAVVIDFRPTAPAAAAPDMYKLDERGRVIGNASVEGGLASAVPGEVKGLLYALDKYGSKTLTRAQVMQPAIDWAERGVPVTVNLAQIIKDNYGKLSKFENGLAIYSKDGFPPEIGDTIVNKDLANTLRLIQAKGADAIYTGDIAAKIVAENRKRGGILSLEDLAGYQVKVRTPVTGSVPRLHHRHRPAAGRGHARPPVAEHPRDGQSERARRTEHRRRASVGGGLQAGLRRSLEVLGRPGLHHGPHRRPGLEGLRKVAGVVDQPVMPS